MVAGFILGQIAPHCSEASSFLRHKVAKDGSWQVQEIPAQASNEYCKRVGYQESTPIIRNWLDDKNPNVRRAVTEDLRSWNQKDCLQGLPDVAIALLAKPKADESNYVRRSVGNALHDISRKEKDLIPKELANWDTSNPDTRFTNALAAKFW